MAASLGTHVVLRGTHETRIRATFCAEKNRIIELVSSSQSTRPFKEQSLLASKSSLGWMRGRAQMRVYYVYFGLKAMYFWLYPAGVTLWFLDLTFQPLVPIIEFIKKSTLQIKEEIKKCYELINRVGRGVVYLGSSRMGPSHSHYIENLLDCTTWSGGPGLMDAVTEGAMLAGKPVGGFKIGREAGEWTASNFHPYLSSENYLTCRFFPARKHGLVDAVVRNNSFDKTAVVALPCGIDTLDEVFEILALIQLEWIGSKLHVPFLLMNYDSFIQSCLNF
ncbi:hypothetical protein GmHk_18G051100 [Glycine max]|nr:hypothetical protein GmHk_18G051100 [Glycine max]